MLKKFQVIGLCLLISGLFFIFFCPVLKAEEVDKNDAVAMTLARLEEENTFVPAQAVQPQEDIEYRQRLRELITVENKEDLGLAADTYVRYMPSRSLDSQPGKISIIDSASEFSYDFKAGEKLPIELSLNTRYISLNANEAIAVSLPAKLTGIGFGVQATLPTYIDKMYFRLRVLPTFNSDNWNLNGSTLRIPTHSFLIYQPSEQWIFIGGVAVYPREQSPVLPIAGFIYKPNDRLAFNIIPTPSITYAINKNVTAFLDGDMSSTEFKVNKDGYKGAILSYNEIHLGAGLDLKVNKNINSSFSFGRMFNRNLKYRDSLGKVTMKNDYYTEFRVEMSM